MAAQESSPLPPPPGIVSALTAGFDAIATRPGVIVLPILLDLFLWLGPRLRIETLFTPIIARAQEFAQQGAFPQQDIQQATLMWQQFLQLNLASNLRSLPIGVTSLMATTANTPLENPLGPAMLTEINSFAGLLAWFALFTLLGWLLGSVYYYQVSKAALRRSSASTSVSLPQVMLQTLLLNMAWWALAFLVGIPLTLFFALLAVINLSLAQVFTFLIGLFFIWLLLPIYFSAHGIFVYGQNAFRAIMQSLRLVRFTMPSLGLFVVTMLIINEGLNYLWRVPAPTSWLLLVGIVAHAFISSALLAASFIYYRDLNAWLQIMLEKLQTQTTSARA